MNRWSSYVLPPRLGAVVVQRYLQRCSIADASPQKQGLFGVEVLKEPSGFTQLHQAAVARCDKLVKKIVNPLKKKRKTVKLFDDLSNEICCAADLAECVRSLHSNVEFAAAAEKSMHDFTVLVESYNTDSRLYNALNDSLISEREQLTDVDCRTIHLFVKDFEQSGIHLPFEKKAEFVKLSGAIFEYGSRFVAEAEKPVGVSSLDRRKYGVDRYLTGPASMTIASSTRKWSYETYYRHNEHQEAILRHIVTCRHRLAQMTGFKTYSERAQLYSILGCYENAHEFLTSIIKACRASAERELTVLLDVLIQCDQQAEKIGEWDLPFLCSVYRRKAYGDLHSLRKYFSFSNLVKGVALAAEKWYGLKFNISEPDEGEIWPGNVIKLEVRDEKGDDVGTIYLDIEDRSSKSLGPCHFTVRCSKLLDDGTYQTPIVVVSLSIASEFQPINSVFLSVHQAENLLHEMGHALHSILGRTEYQHVAGTRCPTDMAEIPSNLMEYFFNDVSVLKKIAVDENGTPISIDEATNMIASRFAFTSLDLMQQAVQSLFDLELHGHNAEGIINGKYTTTDLFRSIWSTVLPGVALAPNSAYHHRFTHLVHYGAKYYSYLVARAAASLIWNSRFRDDPFSEKSGRNWAKVQSFGGSMPSLDLLDMALGYAPTNKILSEAISNEAKFTCQETAVNL